VQALLVYTEPPGAEVKLEGRARGKTPFHLALPPGEYALRLEREGLVPVAREVTIPPDASVTVDVVLAPLPPSPATKVAAPAPPPAAKPDLSAPQPKPAAIAGPPIGGEPKPEAPRAKRRLWTWVAAGAAVAAVSAGAYYGVAAKDAASTLDDGTIRSTTTANALEDDAKSKARTANVLYGVAGVAAATGATLFFLEGSF
jgi:hypothetical protein